MKQISLLRRKDHDFFCIIKQKNQVFWICGFLQQDQEFKSLITQVYLARIAQVMAFRNSNQNVVFNRELTLRFISKHT